jgi:ubiquitin C-terminal hydrolase
MGDLRGATAAAGSGSGAASGAPAREDGAAADGAPKSTFAEIDSQAAAAWNAEDFVRAKFLWTAALTFLEQEPGGLAAAAPAATSTRLSLAVCAHSLGDVESAAA